MDLFWILYIISVPIAFVSYWIAVTLCYNTIYWKNITRGDFILGLILSLFPILNGVLIIVALGYYLYETGWLNKKVFK